MKIILLSGASSIHTLRWANGLSAAGVQVHVISQQLTMAEATYNAQLHLFPTRGAAGYLLMVPSVRKLIAKIQPDLVNAHYASGYGTTARLVNYRPWLLSVWGSDVYDFPYKSALHRWGVASNLEAADAVASTSHCMARQTQNLVPSLRGIAVTPFGVDCSHFSPHPDIRESIADAPIVIGTVKTLAHTYGVDLLIKAFSFARQALLQNNPALAARLRLRIVGSGPDSSLLQQITVQQQVFDVTEFAGHVPHDQVIAELHKLDIYVALSRRESFGVAAIEAGAAGLPVVVSDVGGLPEVVRHGETGLVVPNNDVPAAADALLLLINNSVLRHRLGAAGRDHVLSNYSWNACIKNMIGVYQRIIDEHKQ